MSDDALSVDPLSLGDDAGLKRKRHPRLIMQSEASECGLACIAMIAFAYGYDIDLPSLRRKFPVSERGQSFEDLVRISAGLGMGSRAVKAELCELKDLHLPCVIHWDINHFVVLTKVGSDYVVVLDPASGQKRISLSELSKHFTGAVVELFPGNDFKQANLRQSLRISDLWSGIRGLKTSLSQILLLSLMFQLCVIAAPLFMQSVVDRVIQGNQWNLLAPIALGFSLLVVTQAGINLLRSYAILHLSSRLNLQMASNLFHHLIRLPMDYFMRRHLGDITSRFESLNQVRQMMATGIVSAGLDGIMSVVTLMVLIFYSVELTSIVLVVVFLYCLLRLMLFQTLRRLHQEMIVSGAEEQSHFVETLRAVLTIKVFQKEPERQSQWLNKLAKVVNKDIQVGRWNAGFTTANAVLFGLENILVVYIAVGLVQQDQMSLGMLFAFISFKMSFVNSVNNVINLGIDFKMLGLHFERISDIVFTKKEQFASQFSFAQEEKDPINNVGRELSGRIEVRNLAFCYEGEQDYIFRHVSFAIEPGESVAIIGPSGSGKTTLLKCLMGLLRPTEGEILIDGIPLEKFAGYRAKIAGVMQDDQLISGTIEENIAFFAPVVDQEKVQRCASNAYIHDNVMRMPMQYNTLVGDLGSSLSGGQKQRIILARALYREPKILFMDEATSHLDVESESLVTQKISELAITRVLVAHRPETVRSAGKQINMADFVHHVPSILLT